MYSVPPFAECFGFFDPTQPYSVTYGELPHWEQEGATYFLTFRTADSLPRSVVELLRRQRDDWLLRHGINPQLPDWQQRLQALPHQAQREFHRTIVTVYEAALDKGLGSCPLRDHKLAKFVADSLLHFDGVAVAEAQRKAEEDGGAIPNREVRCHVSDFVVMPNHVHVMVCLLSGVRLPAQCKSWKHFSAVQINRELKQRGEFWQSESFDHLVRDADHFDRFRKYIAENAAKAGLSPNEVIHYQRSA